MTQAYEVVLLLFIAGFLSNRQFQVKVAGTYSKTYNQEAGIHMCERHL